ncbi:uncharacterized protein LOC122093522 [Macadamia integrifolia]|uniref:uncharacterized protein LOC122093522 n=1 Tax=Macadamia integrifolia TaxID=60698 RepID=UPI001C52A0F6|nr:uncharacterized protein LOC122093522 [Macadamia integrifolia]
MATLQKFKLLATQCAIAGSPTRSPTTSPVIHLRRRKSLRMLLSRSSGSGRRLRREESPDLQGIVTHSQPPEKRKELLSRTLKDLFISSPPPQEDNPNKTTTEKITKAVEEAFPSSIINRGNGSPDRQLTVGSPRPLSAVFRYRLLRRAWRPVLVAIPESKETI